MGSAQERLMRQLFVAMMLFTAALLALGTLYPVKLHTTGMQVLRWTYQNVLDTTWFAYLFLAFVFGAMAIILLAGMILVISKTRIWYHRLRGPNYRRYDDPEYIED